MLDKIGSSHFTFEKWRAGNLSDLDLFTRYADITSTRGKAIIKRYAVGYCEASNIPCRPKPGRIAVMFLKGEYFWSHLMSNEFNEIFKLSTERFFK